MKPATSHRMGRSDPALPCRAYAMRRAARGASPASRLIHCKWRAGDPGRRVLGRAFGFAEKDVFFSTRL